MKQTCSRLVVTEDIKRVFAEVEAAIACPGFTLMFVGFTLFELKSAALHVFVKALKAVDNCNLLLFGLRFWRFVGCHCPSSTDC
jgi:hypothetical protein